MTVLYYKLPLKLPNAHKMYQMAIYSKWPYITPTFPIPRLSKIYPNWDFWFENVPSGNPGVEVVRGKMKKRAAAHLDDSSFLLWR
jgi:hypothetical protein